MILERARRTSISGIIVTSVLIAVVAAGLAVGAYHQSGDARFCGSCHSMQTVHSRWEASNHRQFSCVECHLPDTHIAGKVAYKTRAGLNDLIHETARDYPAGIGMSDESRHIVNGNCVRCHASTIADTKMASDGADCLKCHRYLVHGRGLDQGGIKIE
ncbi:MAG: NapC/NirT family cytochrome c [Smithellaceae bacterium]